MGPTEVILVVVLVALAFLLGRDTTAFRRIRDWFASLNPVGVLMLVAAVFFALVAASAPWNFGIGITGLLALALAVLWYREFRFLMNLPDDAFPGHSDKTIWALLLIVLPPVGMLAFHSYRRAHWPESKTVAAPAAHDLG